MSNLCKIRSDEIVSGRNAIETLELNQSVGLRKSKKSVLLIENAQLIRESLIEVLGKHARDIRFFGIGAGDLSVDELPNMILLYTRSGIGGDAGVQQLFDRVARTFSGTPIMVLAETEDRKQAAWAIRNGANGYFPTSLSMEILAAAIRLILAGGTFVPAEIVIDEMSDRCGLPRLNREAGLAAPQAQVRPAQREFVSFTDREHEIVSLMRCGEPNKVIARKLAISPSTVKVHVHNIMSKLNANNRTQAMYMLENLQESAH